MNSCVFCNLNDNQTLIKDFKYWQLIMHTNQQYIGRTILVTKEHKIDLSELSEKEQTELFEILKILKKIYQKTFNPSLLNYSVLGNEIEHLHIHILPRYNKPIVFNGHTFSDEKYGHNPYPYNKNYTIPVEIFEEIRNTLTRTFS